MPPRKPRPDYLTRDEVETMIAEAVAAERTRSEQAMAGLMLALGGAAQALDFLGDALGDVAVQLDRHEAFISGTEAPIEAPQAENRPS